MFALSGKRGVQVEIEIITTLVKDIVDVLWFCRHDTSKQLVWHFLPPNIIELVMRREEEKKLWKVAGERKRHLQTETIKDKFLKRIYPSVSQSNAWGELSVDIEERRQQAESWFYKDERICTLFPACAGTVDLARVTELDSAPQALKWAKFVLAELCSLAYAADEDAGLQNLQKTLVEKFKTIYQEAVTLEKATTIAEIPIRRNFGCRNPHLNKKITLQNTPHPTIAKELSGSGIQFEEEVEESSFGERAFDASAFLEAARDQIEPEEGDLEDKL
ncbi:hypothetical protein G7Y89_g11697 [Cudoniella acicularis]|uniref:Uncharacterized protein n=1 Tax=Cudoniella acicularis TaxID=354080 RepID=A0A8H4RE25_9HELO|nr:hypothetical protein G7Y89_g11697 [Cudoniella acicularis]